MIGVLLFIVSLILIVLVTPLGLTATTIKSLIFYDSAFIKKYYMDLAISLDQFGNVLMQGLFNRILINSCRFPFGNPDETISSVIGKNSLNNSLTYLGVLLDRFLNVFELNHSIKSIEKDEIS